LAFSCARCAARITSGSAGPLEAALVGAGADVRALAAVGADVAAALVAVEAGAEVGTDADAVAGAETAIVGAEAAAVGWAAAVGAPPLSQATATNTIAISKVAEADFNFILRTLLWV